MAAGFCKLEEKWISIDMELKYTGIFYIDRARACAALQRGNAPRKMPISLRPLSGPVPSRPTSATVRAVPPCVRGSQEMQVYKPRDHVELPVELGRIGVDKTIRSLPL